MSTTVPFDPFAEGEILRLSPTTAPQQEIIASSKMSDEANTAFNEAVCLRFTGTVDIALLERSINALIQRHDILRATFSSLGDQLCLQEFSPLSIDYQDLRAYDLQTQQQITQTLFKHIAVTPMDLEKGGLFFVWVKQWQDKQFELIISVHHIVCDGWSFGLLLNELADIYRHGSDASHLSPAPSFFDFADYYSASQIANTDVDYWLNCFEHLPPILDLPLDKQRPALRSFTAARYDYSLDPSLVKRLPKAASFLKSSLVNYVLAGYFALLYRLTGVEDIVVGLPVAGQSSLNQPNLLGHMVQLLPIRISLQGDTPFKELVALVKEQVLTAREHSNFTFGQLLENITVDRSRVPLVCTIFNIDQAMPALDFGRSTAIMKSIPRAAENFELFLNVVPSHDQLIIEATYSSVLFTEQSIMAWLNSLETLLKSALENPDIQLNNIALAPVLPDVVNTANQTAKQIQFADFISAFYHQQSQNPESIAVVCGNRSFTYTKLDSTSTQLAHVLLNQGIKINDVVGLCCQRSEYLLIGTLAILKIGAAYLPLDPDFPAGRLLYMLEDSDAVAIIEDDSIPQAIADTPLAHINLNTPLNPSTELTLEPLSVSANRLAYMIYTSGSTGKPKGVKVQNSAMINFLESMQVEPHFTAQDRLLAITTLSFDISVLELFLPLICGGTTIIATRDESKDSERLAKLINQHNISIMQATPATWRLLLLDSEWHAPQLKALCGGEPLPLELAQRLSSQVGELWNMFGPTETTVWSSCKKIQPDDQLMTVGQPIANTQIYILDKQLNPLPVSIPGELCIAGEGVTLGYHNRTELNAEKFIHHPQWGLLYRTGDSAKILANGEIQHLGRLDNQVKLRGYRIELGEIETALEDCLEIEQALVYLWEIDSQDIRLVACCVSVNTQPLNAHSLREQLKQSLPSYMIPQYFLTLDSIPLTPNGKINRNNLPKPSADESLNLSPKRLDSDLEKLIAQQWTALLKVNNQLDKRDNFFDIGGYSLLGTQLIAKLNATFSISLSLKDIFIAPTIEQQASLIKTLLSSGNGSLSKIKPRQDNHSAPASSQQLRLWYLEQVEPDSKAYNLSTALGLEGKLNVSALQQAVDIIVDRQAALRTNFNFVDGQLLQTVRADLPLDLTVQVLPDEVDGTNKASLHDFLKQQRSEPFDLSKKPLFKAQLFYLAEDQHVLFLRMHHLIFDGWSFDIIFHELYTLYNQLSKGEKSPLLTLPVTYTDYAYWQQNHLKSEQIKQQLQYWTNKFSAEQPILSLPEDYPRPAIQAHQSAIVNISLTEQQVLAAEDQCKALGCTLFMLLISVYALMLARYSQQKNIIVGIPVSGRGQNEISDLLGFFVNTLALRFDVQPKLSFQQWLNHVKQVCIEAYANQDLPFDMLVKKLQLKRDQSRSPLFQVFLLFQDTRNRTDNFETLKKRHITVDNPGVQTDIDFWIKRELCGLIGGFEYPTALFDHSTVDMFANSFLQILDSVVNNPQVAIKSLITAHSTEIIRINQWNNTLIDVSDQSFLHYFQQSVQSYPDKIALISQGMTLSYQRLDQQSTQLAHFLQQQGIQQGSLVALCLNRHAHLLISLLAIWKAGAAYVPLDPSYPELRLQYMLEMSAIQVMVTESTLINVANNYPCQRICIDNLWTEIEQMPTVAMAMDHQANDLAYVIFTSGSTGKPKGVKVPHRAVTNFLSSMAKCPKLKTTDHLLAVTSLSFDIAVLELYLPLIQGASVIIADAKDTVDGEKMKALINDYQINIMQATPNTWRLLLASGWTGGRPFKVLCGGEAFPIDLAQQLLDIVGEVWNMYGPTETTVWSTCYRLQMPLKKVLIGQPIANTQCYILDTELNQLPIGVAGELYIGGEGVTRGYLGQDELTKERFIKDPFSENPDAYLYQTGDLVCWQKKGQLAYFKRLDNQIKLRGYRIELEEIEAVLLSHPTVLESAVVIHHYNEMDQRLVAYVCLTKNQSLNKLEIRQFLRNTLPDYMIPQGFVKLDTMPLTDNGKLNRQALSLLELDTNLDNEETTEQNEQNDFELSILVVWRTLLKMPHLSMTDNFFDSGGHSLLAISAVEEMKLATGVTFDVGMLFQHPTVEELVAFLGSDIQHNSSNVVLLKEHKELQEQSKPPLFLLCGVNIYQHLANAIENQTIYGVYVYSELAIAQDAMEGKVGRVSFDLLSENYVTAIRRHDPEGPYQLGGISFGGFIAMEVARKLRALGAEVTQVFLLDTGFPDAYKRNMGKYVVQGIFSLDKKMARLSHKVGKMVSNKMHPSEQPLTEKNQAMLLREQAFINMMKENDNTAIYEGNVILFKAQDRNVPDWVEVEASLGWQKVVPNSLTVIDSPGDHLGIIDKEHVDAGVISSIINGIKGK